MFEVLRRHPVMAVLAVALLLRLAAAFGLQAWLDGAGREYLIPGDAEGYWMLAERIAEGEDYAVYDPPRRVLRMPGFPLLLAGVRLVAGDSFLALRVTLAFVGTAACAAVYLLGSTLLSPRVGLIAAAIAAFWPALIGFSVLVLSETLFALFLTLSLVAMGRLVRSTRRPDDATNRNPDTLAGVGRAATTGALITVASYVRPTWLPAAILFAIAYWLWAGRSRASALVAAVILISASIALAPWTIRNRLVTGHWVPTTLWVGPSLYDGLNPRATGASDMRFFDEDRLLDRMSEYDMDREYRRRAWQFVRENPGRAFELAAVKLWRYWRPWPGADQFTSPAAILLVAGYYLPVLALSALGAWHRPRDVWLIALTSGPILLFSLVHCIFVSSLRYRLPAEYPLCVLAAVGAHRILAVRTALPA